MPVLQYDVMRRLVGKAMASSGTVRKGLITWKWDLAGDCEAPRTVTYWSRPAKRGKKFIMVNGRTTQVPLYLDTETRCRKCAACARARSSHWRLRTMTELAAGGRAWFITLTLRPVAAMRNLDRARHKASKRGHDLDLGTDSEIFGARVAALGEELTLFIKRLRKNSQAKLRYIAVFEAHKSGVPHVHMLVREVAGTVTHRHISEAWVLGFSKANLVDHSTTKAAWYVTKYLAKSMMARVRASFGWGAQSAALPSVEKQSLDIGPVGAVQTDSLQRHGSDVAC